MYTINENSPDASIYRILREKVNFREYEDSDVEIALKNSLYCVTIFDDTRAIGIARLVGDNRICFFLKDVVVDPEYQKLKVGSLLMKHIFAYIEKHACDGAYVGLMSTPQCVSFYERYGFKQRPCEGMGPGMILFHKKGGGK